MAYTKVFAGNLSFRTKEDQLAEHFAVAGKVVSANIITRGPRSLGYGFVEFETEEQAVSAVNLLNKKTLTDVTSTLKLPSLVKKSPSSSNNNNKPTSINSPDEDVVALADVVEEAILSPLQTTTTTKTTNLQIPLSPNLNLESQLQELLDRRELLVTTGKANSPQLKVNLSNKTKAKDKAKAKAKAKAKDKDKDKAKKERPLHLSLVITLHAAVGVAVEDVVVEDVAEVEEEEDFITATEPLALNQLSQRPHCLLLTYRSNSMMLSCWNCSKSIKQ